MGLADSFGLQPHGSARLAKGAAIGAHTKHRQHARRIMFDFGGQPLASCRQFILCEFVGCGRGTFDQVCDAISQRQQFLLFRRRELARRKTAQVQRRPEAVARARKMVASRGSSVLTISCSMRVTVFSSSCS